MRPPRGLAAPFAASILTTNGLGRNRQPARNPRDSRTKATTAMRSPIPLPTGPIVEHAVVGFVREPLPVVGEAQWEALVALLEQGDRLLQVVLVLAGDPELVALDLSLHLQAGLADRLGERLRLVFRDALEERALDPVGAAAGGSRLRGGQRLERDRAPDQLLLEDVQGGQRPLVGLGDDHHVLARPGDRGTGVLEVEALAQLLPGLVQGVVDLLAVDLGDDVERGIGHAQAPFAVPPRTLAPRLAWYTAARPRGSQVAQGSGL